MLIGLCIARLTKGHSKSESIAEELGDGAQWGLAARDLCKAKDGNELLEHFGLLEQHRRFLLEQVIDAALPHDPHQLHGNLGIAGGDQ